MRNVAGVRAASAAPDRRKDVSKCRAKLCEGVVCESAVCDKVACERCVCVKKKLYVCACVSVCESCAAEGGEWDGADGSAQQKQEPHAKMWGNHS